ncbi:hypothetical protein SADUNF_Sadunf13G0012000 [Salix dunnii]|uniref:Aminotransferase-like plant mobile domain-containing protein n=1 Tax=Salix dunnii TaxID=1413687 RepID=A0A835JK29_9ROSI|nr:hypothetical protein SADUNF_Sadunf13G0012000 [Salix dunnii]
MTNKWGRFGRVIVWCHRTDEAYCNWVEKLEKGIGQKWRDLRIYGTIVLSTRSISVDDPLMSELVCLWDNSCNAFFLHEGPVSITMEDVVAITSRSPDGIELSTLETTLLRLRTLAVKKFRQNLVLMMMFLRKMPLKKEAQQDTERSLDMSIFKDDEQSNMEKAVGTPYYISREALKAPIQRSLETTS